MISRLEDGRIIKLENAAFSELVNGEWAPLSKPMSLGDHWNSEELSERELKELPNSVGSN